MSPWFLFSLICEFGAAVVGGIAVVCAFACLCIFIVESVSECL